jgi:hypothetical protein
VSLRLTEDERFFMNNFAVFCAQSQPFKTLSSTLQVGCVERSECGWWHQ